MKFKAIDRKFYDRNTLLVAPDLLGKYLVRKLDSQYLVGIISELEAYTHDDPACHCFSGKTERNKSMFGPVGHGYVYKCYGIHNCFNIVARSTAESPSGGCLIRSVIPILGINQIKKNRGGLDTNLTDGPGKLTQAFLISKIHDGIDLTDANSELFVAEGKNIDSNIIRVSERIGISKAKDKLWRFYIDPGKLKIDSLLI